MFARAKRLTDTMDRDRAYAAANPPKCGNCRFWDNGWCRRYPPPFPPVAELARCGEYKRLWPEEEKS